MYKIKRLIAVLLSISIVLSSHFVIFASGYEDDIDNEWTTVFSITYINDALAHDFHIDNIASNYVDISPHYIMGAGLNITFHGLSNVAFTFGNLGNVPFPPTHLSITFVAAPNQPSGGRLDSWNVPTLPVGGQTTRTFPQGFAIARVQWNWQGVAPGGYMINQSGWKNNPNLPGGIHPRNITEQLLDNWSIDDFKIEDFYVN